MGASNRLRHDILTLWGLLTVSDTKYWPYGGFLPSPTRYIDPMGASTVSDAVNVACSWDMFKKQWQSADDTSENKSILPICCRCLPCGFEVRLVQDFQIKIKYLPSQYWDIVSMLRPRARHFILKCFTWLRWKWVPGRTEMAMCTIRSMRRNGCETACSPWSWNDTRMNSPSDHGVKCEIGW